MEREVKKYLVFMFDDYYPGGGWNDFVNSFDSIEEGKKVIWDEKQDNSQIVDSHTGEIIFQAHYERTPRYLYPKGGFYVDNPEDPNGMRIPWVFKGQGEPAE